MNKLEKFLFQLTIFLIPTNLAYHFISTHNYLNGILVDYLIPKIYISDIPILILLVLWFLNSYKKWAKEKVNINFKSTIIPSLFFLLLVRGFFSNNPLAATWFWIKLLQYSLFFNWIRVHSRKGFSQTIVPPLMLSLVFQSLVGIFQVIFQRSLVGYKFLGETTLLLSSQIDKIHLAKVIPGLGRSLLIPAYGTTPHNNVLAGFLSIGIVSLYLLTRETKKILIYQKVNLYITYILSIIALFFTFSISAWISLVIAFLLIGLSYTPSKQSGRLIGRILLSLVIILITYVTIIPNDFNNTSLSRRYQLNQISLDIIKDFPLLGVGLNNYTQNMNQYGSISSNTQFLQPAHNIYLLWFTETGLIGLCIISILIYKYKPTLISKSSISILPIMIILIGLLDHYLITLQSGQLLTILALTISKYKYRL